MLSKSQARWFFIGGTAFFSAIFIFLTIDTLREIPARQNQDKLSATVVRGKHIWDSNNCMGCHTILGEGAYYAPELTRVLERRGAERISVFLKDPQAMFPGRRRMVQYDFSPDTLPLFGAHSIAEREEMMRETLRALLALYEGESWLEENLAALGRSHWEYGLTTDMYDSLVEALLDCSREMLGDDLDESAESSLQLAFREVARQMSSAGEAAARQSG